MKSPHNFLFIAFILHLKKSFNIACKTGLVMVNSLTFTRKTFSSFYLNNTLAGLSILSCRMFCFDLVLVCFCFCFVLFSEKGDGPWEEENKMLKNMEWKFLPQRRKTTHVATIKEPF